jgi:DNA repair photolyase
VSFRWGLNPYRGCFHGCAYCYARPSHEFLGWGAGTDFDRRLVVKTNAPELLAAHFERPAWTGEPVTLSGVTDPYQPLEASYELTRRCLEVCLAYRNPVRLITKGVLVRRDLELLAELSRATQVRVYLSLPFLDPIAAAAMEPSVAPPEARLEALAALSGAGVPTGLSLAPIVPGLNEQDVPELLRRAREGGAGRAFMTMLRLPGATADVFVERLAEALPLAADKVLAAVRDQRGGALHETRFGHRMVGTGPRWAALQTLFTTRCRQLGLEVSMGDDEPGEPTFRRPSAQGTLFPT